MSSASSSSPRLRAIRPLQPVKAELGPLVRKLLIERTSPVQHGESLLRPAAVVEEPGEVVLGAQVEPGLLGRVDQSETLLDMG